MLSHSNHSHLHVSHQLNKGVEQLLEGKHCKQTELFSCTQCCKIMNKVLSYYVIFYKKLKYKTSMKIPPILHIFHLKIQPCQANKCATIP